MAAELGRRRRRREGWGRPLLFALSLLRNEELASQGSGCVVAERDDCGLLCREGLADGVVVGSMRDNGACVRLVRLEVGWSLGSWEEDARRC